MKTLVIALALVGCGNKKQQDPTPAPVGEPAQKDLADIFTGCWDAQSKGDMAALGNCYAENARIESPGAGFPPATDKAKILEAASGLRQGFPDLVGKPALVLVHGDNVAAIVRLSGTNTDTKKAIGLNGGVFLKFDKTKGVVLEEQDFFDSATITGQLKPDPAHPVRAWNATTTIAYNKVVSTGDAKETTNVTTVAKLFGEFNRHDLGAAAALIADDATWSDAAEAEDWSKISMLNDRQIAMKGFSDLQASTIFVWGAGDYVVQTGEITGTNDGPLPGIAAPTKKKITIPYLGIFQVKSDKIAHAWMFEQGSALAKQLGL